MAEAALLAETLKGSGPAGNGPLLPGNDLGPVLAGLEGSGVYLGHGVYHHPQSAVF